MQFITMTSGPVTWLDFPALLWTMVLQMELPTSSKICAHASRIYASRKQGKSRLGIAANAKDAKVVHRNSGCHTITWEPRKCPLYRSPWFPLKGHFRGSHNCCLAYAEPIVSCSSTSAAPTGSHCPCHSADTLAVSSVSQSASCKTFPAHADSGNLTTICLPKHSM